MQRLPFRDSNKDQTKINLTRSIAKEVEDRDKVAGHWNEFQGETPNYLAWEGSFCSQEWGGAKMGMREFDCSHL